MKLLKVVLLSTLTTFATMSQTQEQIYWPGVSITDEAYLGILQNRHTSDNTVAIFMETRDGHLCTVFATVTESERFWDFSCGDKNSKEIYYLSTGEHWNIQSGTLRQILGFE